MARKKSKRSKRRKGYSRGEKSIIGDMGKSNTLINDKGKKTERYLIG